MHAEFSTLSGYSEQWEEYHKWLDAKERLAVLARRAQIHVSLCWTRGGSRKSQDFGTTEARYLTNQFRRGCTVEEARRHPRYWQFTHTYPGATQIWKAAFPEKDPASGWGTGEPLEPTARQYDSRTRQWYEPPGPWLSGCESCQDSECAMAGHSEDIDRKITDQKRLANTLRAAINDWLSQHGINGFVMNEQELLTAIDKINEKIAGSATGEFVVATAFPQLPEWMGPGTPGAPAADPSFFSLQNFSLRRSWPGLVAGVVAGLLFR